MAYNNGREDRKWRIWKEAEEKVLCVSLNRQRSARKSAARNYTVTAHFREDGRDLLGLLSRIFMRDTADYSFDSEGYDED